MYEFLLKILPFITNLLPFYHKHKKTVCLILASVGISFFINDFRFTKFENYLTLPSIESEEASDYVITYMDQVIYRLGEYTFMSWLILERKNDKYILKFKDVRGIMPGENNSISLKFSNITDAISNPYVAPYNPHKKVVSVKNGNCRNIYQDTFVLDKNEEYLINSLKEFEVFNYIKSAGAGYSNLYKILEGTNLGLDKIKFVIVKKKKDVIWIFSLFTKSPLPEEMQDNDLIGTARTAKYRYFKI